ncbi:heptosyltransferase II domain protein, partial [Vibrio parahaemolyticus V-223/04]
VYPLLEMCVIPSLLCKQFRNSGQPRK